MAYRSPGDLGRLRGADRPSRIYLVDHWASDVLGAYLIGGVLLGLAVAVYLPLKERGVLEMPEARARMEEKKALRSFPTKGWF